jgi:hypothetical protein
MLCCVTVLWCHSVVLYDTVLCCHGVVEGKNGNAMLCSDDSVRGSVLVLCAGLPVLCCVDVPEECNVAGDSMVVLCGAV